MRGRTNIPNRREPVINGDIKSFTVAESNIISKGDFVSYKMSSIQNTLGISGVIDTEKTNFHIVDENKSMFIFNEQVSSSPSQYAIRLCKINVSYEVEIVDTIFSSLGENRDSYVRDFWYDSDEKVLSVRRFGSIDGSSQFYFEFYDVSENGFEIHEGVVKNSDLKTASGRTRDFVYLMKISNIYIAIDDWGEICNLDMSLQLNDIVSPYGTGSNNINYIERYDENNIVMVGNSGSSVSGSLGVWIVLYNFINESFYILHDDETPNAYWKFEYQDGVIVAFNTNQTSYCYARLYKFDGDKNKLVRFYSKQFVVNGSSVNGCFSGNKFFIFSSNGTYAKVILVNYNRDSSEVNVVQDELQQFEFTLYSRDRNNAIGLASGNIIFLFAENNYYKVTYESSLIRVGEPTSYVRSYDGRSALGFANTSGNAGDTIQVYVPNNS